MPRQFKIVVEEHSDGYVAYPLGMKGIVVGEGTFSSEALSEDSPLIEAFIAEATVAA
jgi:hypothetical protein